MSGRITVFCDGLCEPYDPGGVATFGFLIYRDGKLVHEGKGVVGTGGGMTNNVAEYSAAISAMEYLLQKGPGGKVTIHSDSMLLVRQMQGGWKVRSPRIEPVHRRARGLVRRLSVRFRWVPRERNEAADRLSVQAYVDYQESKRRARTAGVLPRLSKMGDALYQVQAQPTPYLVDLEEGTCTCPDFRKPNSQRFSVRCKHVLAALEMEEAKDG